MHRHNYKIKPSEAGYILTCSHCGREITVGKLAANLRAASESVIVAQIIVLSGLLVSGAVLTAALGLPAWAFQICNASVVLIAVFILLLFVAAVADQMWGRP